MRGSFAALDWRVFVASAARIRDHRVPSLICESAGVGEVPASARGLTRIKAILRAVFYCEPNVAAGEGR
jgi:hypothetical protein